MFDHFLDYDMTAALLRVTVCSNITIVSTRKHSKYETL